MKSMTGFGRAEKVSNNYEYSIEIKSVNSRYKDIKVMGPKDLLHLEHLLEKMIQKKFHRGKFTVFLHKHKNKHQDMQKLDEKKIVSAWQSLEKVRKKTKLQEAVDFETLVQLNKSWFFESKDERKFKQDDEKIFLQIAKIGFENLEQSRQKEGQDILKIMQAVIAKASATSKKINKQYDKFKKNLQKKILKELKRDKLMKEDSVDNKKEQDLISLQDKADITEELDRLNIHFKHFDNLLTKKGSIGREMDFLLQEINRETNTIGSKSYDVQISNHVILMKTELEKLREQAQNLE